MKLVHWYHAWHGGGWRRVVGEHFQALVDADFDQPVYINTVRDGFEQLTINKVREYALENDGAVLYAHTKGAWDVTDFRDQWRRSMTYWVIGNWRENLLALEEVDAVGCHWLTREQYGNMIETPLFGGNFWMARCDYLRTLPVCSDDNRFEAERWIGLNNPSVLDLLPGWPSETNCTCE